jgi:hypothetical protein
VAKLRNAGGCITHMFARNMRIGITRSRVSVFLNML